MCSGKCLGIILFSPFDSLFTQSVVGLEPNWWGSQTRTSISWKYQMYAGASAPARPGTLGSDLVLENQALIPSR